MDETADIYYVDTRNATHDHRTGGGSRPAWNPAPPSRTVYVPPGGGYRPMAPAAPAQVIYAQPAQQPALATFFGKLTTGQVIELVAGLFAMLQPLPAAPVSTRDAATDIGNLILYQGAIAQHAKRDEQVRTLGGLVGKVLG
jgi:hypothetical protein